MMPAIRRRRPQLPPSGTGEVQPGVAEKLDREHTARLGRIEAARGAIAVVPTDYPGAYGVPMHAHSRSQLLHARAGVVTVTSGAARWMIPPGHALWIPAGTLHAVQMLGPVNMQSIYVLPDAIGELPAELRVVGMTPLMLSLVAEAVAAGEAAPDARSELIMDLMLTEIPRLPPRPLGLPFPAEPRLARLCRAFVAAPNPHLVIDDWADALNMSRRAFTRLFRRETGLTLSLWRQQACLFTALPRLAAGEAVTSVALDLGYDSAAAFTTMFTRMTGTPPRTYLGR